MKYFELREEEKAELREELWDQMMDADERLRDDWGYNDYAYLSAASTEAVDNAARPEDIPEFAMEEAFGDYDFVEEDFFCNLKKDEEEEEKEEEITLKISRIAIKSETFCTPWNGKLYCVDICEDAEERSAWLYNSAYGVKSMMFGCMVKDQSREDFLDMVFSNLPPNIEYYADKYED